MERTRSGHKGTAVGAPADTFENIPPTIGLPEGMNREGLLRAAGVPNDAIGDFLAGLAERYGGPLGFLCSIGIAEATLEAVRGAFLE